MDRREVCIPIKESARSTKSSVVSVSNLLQEGISDEVVDDTFNLKFTSIEEDLLQSSPDANRWILHKVPYMLRQVNEKAYVPRRISIGPYHHDKEHLKATEVIKRRHFKRMIEETQIEPKKIVDAMSTKVQAIRNLYEGPLNHIDDYRFVRMLVLDGCFIFQLFRENKKNKPQIEWNQQVDIECDLLLLENQLPFAVLLCLYSIIKNAEQQEIKRELYDLALGYFQHMALKPKIPARTGYINQYHDLHLLCLVHDSWFHSHEAKKEKKEEDNQEEPMIPCWHFPNQKSRSDTEDEGCREFRSCATDLRTTGIHFRENVGAASLLHIEFAEYAKKLKIARLVIYCNTESNLRNMMAYEQCIVSSDRPTLVCNYVSFMDKLIDSGKDVKLLSGVGIIENYLGDDEVVAKMFNSLGDSIYLYNDCYYEEIAKKLKNHCTKRRRRWYKWLAALKRDYFNSPWSFISFFAAVVLLALTAAQTIFSVLSYVRQ